MKLDKLNSDRVRHFPDSAAQPQTAGGKKEMGVLDAVRHRRRTHRYAHRWRREFRRCRALILRLCMREADVQLFARWRKKSAFCNLIEIGKVQEYSQCCETRRFTDLIRGVSCREQFGEKKAYPSGPNTVRGGKFPRAEYAATNRTTAQSVSDQNQTGISAWRYQILYAPTATTDRIWSICSKPSAWNQTFIRHANDSKPNAKSAFAGKNQYASNGKKASVWKNEFFSHCFRQNALTYIIWFEDKTGKSKAMNNSTQHDLSARESQSLRWRFAWYVAIDYPEICLNISPTRYSDYQIRARYVPSDGGEQRN